MIASVWKIRFRTSRLDIRVERATNLRMPYACGFVDHVVSNCETILKAKKTLAECGDGMCLRGPFRDDGWPFARQSSLPVRGFAGLL